MQISFITILEELKHVGKMKKIAIIIVVTIFLASCGARNRHKTVISEEVKTESLTKDSIVIKEEVVFGEVKLETHKDLSETVIEEVIIEKDGVKETRRKTTIKNDKTSSDSTTTNATSSKETVEEKINYQHSDIKKAIEQVVVKRDAYSVWNLLWLLIPLGIPYLIYKYKDKIWWV